MSLPNESTSVAPSGWVCAVCGNWVQGGAVHQCPNTYQTYSWPQHVTLPRELFELLTEIRDLLRQVKDSL